MGALSRWLTLRCPCGARVVRTRRRAAGVREWRAAGRAADWSAFQALAGKPGHLLTSGHTTCDVCGRELRWSEAGLVRLIQFAEGKGLPDISLGEVGRVRL
jgi:hypothetical protein